MKGVIGSPEWQTLRSIVLCKLLLRLLLKKQKIRRHKRNTETLNLVQMSRMTTNSRTNKLLPSLPQQPSRRDPRLVFLAFSLRLLGATELIWTWLLTDGAYSLRWITVRARTFLLVYCDRYQLLQYRTAGIDFENGGDIYLIHCLKSQAEYSGVVKMNCK